MSCLRSDGLRSISNSISPNFVFSSPRIKGYNFAQFCQHLEHLSIYLESNVINTKQIGDLFIIDLAIQTIDIPKNYYDTDEIKALVTITNHLVQSIKLEYLSSPDEAAYMNTINPIDKQFKPT